MEPLKNPFRLLGASPEDDYDRLTELAELRSLTSDQAFDSLAWLVHPRRRMTAELAWLPRVPQARASELWGSLEAGSLGWDDYGDLPLLAGCNLTAALIAARPDLPSGELYSRGLISLSSAAEALRPEDIMADLNESRRLAGFPLITDLDLLTEGLAEQRRYYLSVLSEALNRRPTAEIVDLMTRLADEATEGGTTVPSLLAEDLIRHYESETIGFWERQRPGLEYLLLRIKHLVAGGRRGHLWRSELEGLVSELAAGTSDWSYLGQPLFLLAASYDDFRAADNELACDILNLACDLNNVFSLHRVAYKMNGLIPAFFPDVGDNSRLARDNGKIYRDNVKRLDSLWRASPILTGLRIYKFLVRRYRPGHLDPARRGLGFEGAGLWALPSLEEGSSRLPDLDWARVIDEERFPDGKRKGWAMGCLMSAADYLAHCAKIMIVLWFLLALLKAFGR
jgi:hypothetical protein